MKVINPKNLPTKPINIIWSSIILFLLLDRFHAPGWVYAIVFTLQTVIFIALLIACHKEDYQDIFKGK